MKLIARHDGDEIPVEVERHGSGYTVTMNGRSVVVDLVTAGPFLYSLRLEDGRQFSLTHHRDAAIAAAAIMAFEDTQRVQLPSDGESAWRRAGRADAMKGRL